VTGAQKALLTAMMKTVAAKNAERNDMRIKKYSISNRQDFIKARYESFLQKKNFIESLPPEVRERCFQTDLDRDYGDGVLKDIVICDSCNKNIPDNIFVMLGAYYVYHIDCIKERLPSNIRKLLNVQSIR
jgi:hypothetical protein